MQSWCTLPEPGSSLGGAIVGRTGAILTQDSLGIPVELMTRYWEQRAGDLPPQGASRVQADSG